MHLCAVAAPAMTHSESGEIPIKPGDIVLIPPNEKHMTRQHRQRAAGAAVLLPRVPTSRADRGIQELLRSMHGHRRPLPAAGGRFRARRCAAAGIAAGRPINAPTTPTLPRPHEGRRAALVIPAVGPKLPPALVRRHAAQARAGHRRRPRPARPDGADAARHSGRQCARRQQQRGRRICRDRRVDAAAPASPGPTPRSRPGQLRRLPRPHAGATISPGSKGLLVGMVGFGTDRPRGRAGVPPHGRAASAIYDPAPPRPSHGAGARRRSQCRSTNCWPPPTSSRCTCRCCRRRAGLIGDAELARMKQGAVLIQAVARRHRRRGGARPRSSASGHLGGAAVDVYSTEPPRRDNPLLTLDGEARARLLLTPHIAGVTRQASAFLFRSAWQNVERVLVRGEPPLNRALFGARCCQLQFIGTLARFTTSLQRVDVVLELRAEFLRRARDHVEAERLDALLHRRACRGCAMISSCSFLTIAGSSPAGPSRPAQLPTSNPGRPCSVHGRQVRHQRRALHLRHRDRAHAVGLFRQQRRARSRTAPAPGRPSGRSAPGSCPCWARAPSRCRPALEQLAGEMRGAADAGRAVAQLAGIGLGVGDELLERCAPAPTDSPPAHRG